MVVFGGDHRVSPCQCGAAVVAALGSRYIHLARGKYLTDLPKMDGGVHLYLSPNTNQVTGPSKAGLAVSSPCSFPSFGFQLWMRGLFKGTQRTRASARCKWNPPKSQAGDPIRKGRRKYGRTSGRVNEWTRHTELRAATRGPNLNHYRQFHPPGWHPFLPTSIPGIYFGVPACRTKLVPLEVGR